MKPSKKTTKKKTTTPKAKPKTRVAIVLDRSGSMGSIREATIEAFNAQVESLRKYAETQDVKVGLITFSDRVDQSHMTLTPISEFKNLGESYHPWGNTALYDAVGSAIADLSALPEASDSDKAFLLVIVTDGMENASRTFNSKTLATLIKALQQTGRWTFTYTGANQDLAQVSETLQIPQIGR